MLKKRRFACDGSVGEVAMFLAENFSISIQIPSWKHEPYYIVELEQRSRIDPKWKSLYGHMTLIVATSPLTMIQRAFDVGNEFAFIRK